MKEELVTCGFTTFNSEDTILRALESAMNQDYKNIEFLVVDDCSEDSTLEKLDNFFSKKDVSYKIIRHTSNLGVAQARNTLLKNTNGEFLAFFDGDDMSKNNRLTEQVLTIKKFEKDSIYKKQSLVSSPLCYSDRLIIFDDNSKLYCNAMFLNEKDYQYKELNIGALLFCNPFPKNSRTGSTATCMLCARTSTLNHLKGFNPNLRRYEDLDLTIRALKNDIPISTIKKPLVIQYYSKKEYKQNEFLYEIKLLNEHRKWLLDMGLYEFAINFINFRKNIFKFKIFNSFYYAYLLIINKPYLFIRKLFSSLDTIFFTIKLSLIKKMN
tara:strand:+ start:503 stop:1477 length:975 start_codon:yes stop_codon:yes gene_type:complete